MKNKTQKINNLFIRRMIYSFIAQLLILGFIIFLFKNYRSHDQLNLISDNLLIKDEYTIDKIGHYEILGSKYALNLELHNLGDMRKLDSIKFVQELKNNDKNQHDILYSKSHILRKNQEFIYTGVSVVSVNNKILGYIITKKKYYPALYVPIEYDLFLILFCIIAIFIINFGLLFLPLKKKIENNTQHLLNFISPKDILNKKLYHINIAEYETIALKFLDERNEITRLQKEKSYYEAKKDIAEQVAHDLRSPLTAINIVLNGKSTYSVEEINIVKNSANRLNAIVNNLVIKTDFKEYNNFQSESIFLLIDSLIIEKKYVTIHLH